MTRVVVTGYASIDYVALLDGTPRADTTTTILARPEGAWPRLGGSSSYVAAVLAAAGIEVAAVSWVGDDAAGEFYREAFRKLGIDVSGIATVPDARTPLALLSYEPGGGCYCFYDPGMPPVTGLTSAQLRLLDTADWLCLTIGPKAVTDRVLDHLGPATRLAWAVKHDPRAIDRIQGSRIAARADLICHSRGEAGFVADALAAAGGLKPGCVVIETRSAEGAIVRQDGSETHVPAQSIKAVTDPTGAGDTLVGGVLACLIAGGTGVEATRAGIAAAASLLAGRQGRTERHDAERPRG